MLVTRTLTFLDGTTSSRDWTVRYRPWPRHAEVHPCLLPEDSELYTGEECPEPTELPPPAEGEDGQPDQTQEEGQPEQTQEEGPEGEGGGAGEEGAEGENEGEGE